MLQDAVRIIEEAGGMQLLEGQASAAKAELPPVHQDAPETELERDDSADIWKDAEDDGEDAVDAEAR